jgi:hypothetical protein
MSLRTYELVYATLYTEGEVTLSINEGADPKRIMRGISQEKNHFSSLPKDPNRRLLMKLRDNKVTGEKEMYIQNKAVKVKTRNFQ